MLVICEDCAKKYNIDESRIRGNRARFTCNQCGHIIIVDKADLRRPLVQSAHEQQQTSSSSIDLLKEMEAPLLDSSENKDLTEEEEGMEKQNERRKPQWKFRGVPVFVYLISIIVFSLICVSLVTGFLYSEYLYTEYLADITEVGENYRERLVFLSSLSFGAVWLFILLVFSVVGRIMHNKFRQLVQNANQLAKGELEIDIVKKGPREVRDLAFALERIRQRLQSVD